MIPDGVFIYREKWNDLDTTIAYRPFQVGNKTYIHVVTKVQGNNRLVLCEVSMVDDLHIKNTRAPNPITLRSVYDPKSIIMALSSVEYAKLIVS